MNIKKFNEETARLLDKFKEAAMRQQSHNCSNAGADDEQVSEEDIVKKNCPVISEDVYDLLPGTLHKGIKPVVDNPQLYPYKSKMALLLSLISAYSSMMPKVRVLYGAKEYSLNISFLYASPAGSGKSVLNYAERIARRIDEHIREDSKKQIEAWEQKKNEWDVMLKKAASKKDAKLPDMSMNPGTRPSLALFSMPSTTSKSQLVLALEASTSYGMLIITNEINSLVDALGKDYGNFADMLCKALVNEKVDQYFKTDSRPILIEFPMLTVCASGTYNQLHHLIPTFEDGLASRFLIMMGESTNGWISQKPDYEQGDYSEHFKALADDALAMWKIYASHNIKVKFTDEQWERHSTIWESKKNLLAREADSDLASIANRHGFTMMRMASTLTMLRYWDNELRCQLRDGGDDAGSLSVKGELVCEDADFEAAETITTCMFEHAMTFATSKVNEQLKGTKSMSDWCWTTKALKALDKEFNTEDFIKVAETLGRKKSSAYSSLNELESQKLIKRVKGSGKRMYRKTKKFFGMIRRK